MEPDGEQSRLETSEIHSWLADLERRVGHIERCVSQQMRGRVETYRKRALFFGTAFTALSNGAGRDFATDGTSPDREPPPSGRSKEPFLRKRRGMHGLPAASDAPTIEPGIQILIAAKDFADRSSIRDPSLCSG